MKFGFMTENRISGNGYRFNLNVFVKICQDLLRCISRILLVRNGRPDVFCKTGVLRNFAKFTGKHLCQILYFDK